MRMTIHGPMTKQASLGGSIFPMLASLCLFVVVCTQPLVGAGEPAPPNAPEAHRPRGEQAQAHQHGEEQLLALSRVGEMLPLDEIPDALKLADRLGKLREREVLRQATLKRWAKLEPGKAFPVIAAMPESRDKVETLRYVAIQLARENAASAAQSVSKLPAGRSRGEAITGVAEAWARTDPQAALAWALSLPLGDTREGALREIRFVWVHTDPIAAARHVTASVPAGNIKNALLTNIAVEWALIDPQAAIQWARNLTDVNERELALARAIESWADRAPDAASKFALTLPPGLSRQRTVVAVAGRWATQAPEVAAVYAATLKEPELRLPSLAAVMQLWASVSPAAAGKWAGDLAPKPSGEDALSAYLAAVADWAPDMGLRIIERTAPQMAAGREAEACARQWLGLDRAAAGTWINDSKLPREIKTKWLTPAGL